MKNYYEILQVDKKATSEVINRIYKYHIKKNHPDLFEGKEKEEAKQKVQRFNEAYEVLSSEEKRKQYDESLEKIEIEKEKVSFEISLESLKRLEEENSILQEQLLYKDRLLKQILDELNIPYEDGNIQKNEEVVEEKYNENDLKNKVLNKYMEKVKITVFKIIVLIVLSIFLVITLSRITGNNYIDFLKSLF